MVRDGRVGSGCFGFEMGWMWGGGFGLRFEVCEIFLKRKMIKDK